MEQTSRAVASHRFRRRGALGLSVLLVGLQLLGVAHLVLERHGVCWEHGTVTEARAGELAAPLTVGPTSEAALRGGHSAVGTDGDAHHHCPVQASRRDWAAPPTPAVLVSSVGLGWGDVAFAETLPFVDGALLLRAPKQSPPLAG
jgi:hypothetical protein